jgi:hypothetical protein
MKQSTQANPYVHFITMRSLLTAADMSGTASISWARRGCDVIVMDDDDAGASGVAGDALRDCAVALLACAAGNDSSDNNTVPVGGRSTACVASPVSFDQATLRTLGNSEGAGATLFMSARNNSPSSSQMRH